METEEQQRKLQAPSWLNVITIGAGLLLLLHLTLKYGSQIAAHSWPSEGLDPTALVLVVVAFVPWIAVYLTSAKLPGGIEFEFRQVQRRQDLNEQAISQLRFIVKGFVSKDDLEYLKKVQSDNGDTEFDLNKMKQWETEKLETSLRRLRDHFGLIENVEERGISNLMETDTGSIKKYSQYVRMTPEGNEYLKMREIVG